MMYNRKNNTTAERYDERIMSDHGLFLPNRQVSGVIVVGILSLVICFMSGYYWGKTKAIEEWKSNDNHRMTLFTDINDIFDGNE